MILECRFTGNSNYILIISFADFWMNIREAKKCNFRIQPASKCISVQLLEPGDLFACNDGITRGIFMARSCTLFYAHVTVMLPPSSTCGAGT